MEIKRIVIAGAGTMGYSMAEIFARKRYSVVLYDLNDQALKNAEKHIRENTDTLVEERELDRQEADKLLNNLEYTTSKDCFKNCDLVVESIVEKLEIKSSFFREISEIVREDTILATNTSGLSINALADAVRAPERFLGMHWFNPPHLVPLIEIIKGDKTKDEIAEAIEALSLKIQKKPVIVQKDVPGFAANRIQFAVLREALSMVEQGVISAKGIDDVMKYGLGFRYACLGPLEVADFGGLDIFYHISQYLMKDLCDSKEVPSMLKACFEEGNYGVKTKKGFYDYSDGKDVEAAEARDRKLLKLFHALYKNE